MTGSPLQPEPSAPASPSPTAPTAPSASPPAAQASCAAPPDAGGARWSAGQLHRAARDLFPTGPLATRALQHYRPFICPFEHLLPHVPPGSRVLDIGCGGGLWLGLLAATGRLGSGVGFDSSKAAIRQAQAMRLPASAHGRVMFEHRAVEDPWPDGPFDVVCLIDVLHHVTPEHQGKVIALATKRVARGGRFIYKDMCQRPRWRALANRAHDLVLARQWIHYAPVEQVSRWSVSEGLTLVHAASHARWWYGHELRVFVKG